jgi:sporulation protein YlmC with PRC-barrel domain
MNNPQVLSSDSLTGTPVINVHKEALGNIEELMIDLTAGRVAYAVLSFGGILGFGNKLFAIPWKSLVVDTENERFILDIARDKLKEAPGFDKDHWPDLVDREYGEKIYSFYGHIPYWSDN